MCIIPFFELTMIHLQCRILEEKDASHIGSNFWIWKSVWEFIVWFIFHHFEGTYSFGMMWEGILLVTMKPQTNFLATSSLCWDGTNIRLFTEYPWHHHRSRSRKLCGKALCNFVCRLLFAIKGRCKSTVKFATLVLEIGKNTSNSL